MDPVVPDANPPIVRGRGRPPKYPDEATRKQANKERMRNYMKDYAAKNRASINARQLRAYHEKKAQLPPQPQYAPNAPV